MRILIAEDDDVLADGLTRSLRHSGYAVDHVANGVEADSALSTQTFDLLILDLGLPRMPGLEVLKRLRARGAMLPVMILTAADGVDERVKGLDLGADDYMAKPFALDELLARLRALVRRSGTTADSNDPSTQSLSFGDLVLNTQTREVLRGARQISLTRTEFALLEAFMQHPRRVLERSWLLNEVWGFDFPTTANSLEVYIGYLRRKTEVGDEPRLIHTVRGVGYVLRETPP